MFFIIQIIETDKKINSRFHAVFYNSLTGKFLKYFKPELTS